MNITFKCVFKKQTLNLCLIQNITDCYINYSQWKGRIYYMLTDPFIRIGNAPPFNANQLVIYWPGSVHEARRFRL